MRFWLINFMFTHGLLVHADTRDYVVIFNPALVEVVRTGLNTVAFEILHETDRLFVVRGAQRMRTLRDLEGVTHVERNSRLTKSCVQAVGH